MCMHMHMCMSLPCGAPYLATPPYLAAPPHLVHTLTSFFRGLAGITAGGGDYLCAGTSSGEIALLACNAGSFGHPVVLKEQGTACGAYASFGGDTNALCTALRLRKQWLLSAYCTGHVRLHDVLSKSLVVQVLQSVVSSKVASSK